MRRVHIIGGKNHGKTTLLCELVAEFNRRGLRVGTIKHTHHQHELDAPGKDSHRHRESGAAAVGILSKTMNAVFWPNSPIDNTEDPPAIDARYAQFESALGHCDLVLVEGDIRTSGPKIEVWRAALDAPPIAGRVTDILAFVSDDPVNSPLPVLPRHDVPAIADFIRNLVEASAPQDGRDGNFNQRTGSVEQQSSRD